MNFKKLHLLECHSTRGRKTHKKCATEIKEIYREIVKTQKEGF